MKIGMWFTTDQKINVHTIALTTFGGCESEALHLARALHQVYRSALEPWPISIFGNVTEAGAVVDTALFLNYDNLPKAIETRGLDILIVVRAHNEIISPRHNHKFFPDKKPKIILWSGDAADQNNNETLQDRFTIRELAGIVLKSEWQRQDWLSNFVWIKDTPLQVIRKGFDISHLSRDRSDESKPRFIYASTAFRGLELFLDIWPKIKKAIPDATLDCYPKTTLYVSDNNNEVGYHALYQALEKLPGLKIHNPLPQREFLKVLPNYYAMLYPNHGFQETVCGVALEAMASGVPVITTKMAGLIETIEEGRSILVEPGKEYAQKFVDTTLGLWHEKKLREDISKYGFHKVRENRDMRVIAQIWMRLLDGV